MNTMLDVFNFKSDEIMFSDRENFILSEFGIKYCKYLQENIEHLVKLLKK